MGETTAKIQCREQPIYGELVFIRRPVYKAVHDDVISIGGRPVLPLKFRRYLEVQPEHHWEVRNGRDGDCSSP